MEERRQKRSLTLALWPPEQLPKRAVWAVILLTSFGMALANLATVFAMEFLVGLKFNALQASVDYGGVDLGALVLVGIDVGFVAVAAGLIYGLAPDAGGSGAPENKGWLNGCNMHRFFTTRNLIVRALATILANVTEYPGGREGPSVTMGSNMAFVICRRIAVPHAREWADLQGPSPGAMADEQFFARAARVASAVGGACGVAMIFNSPLGGILYMFEEISPAAWPVELTFQAFVGCIVCTTVSYVLLYFGRESIHSFVIFELWWGTEYKDYSIKDVPGFIITSVILGLLAPLHTMLCLKCLDWRKRLHATPSLEKRQPWPKIADALSYVVFCALVATTVSLLGNCHETPTENGRRLPFFRYNCPDGSHNAVASLLLTTAESAVKRLFNRSDTQAFELSSLALAFVAYTSMNIGLTGITVPFGNFTGAMMIGGLMGRIVGRISFMLLPDAKFAQPGIYSMIGAAAMLSSVKQTSLAVVLFIVTCGNNLDLTVPLMFAVSISLTISRCLGAKAFDEEQVRRKKIQVLEPEPCEALRRRLAKDLVDDIPPEAILPPQMDADAAHQALELCEAPFLPVLAEDGRCLGLVPRTRLEAALQASPRHLPAARLADPPFIVLLDDTPAIKFYALFAKAQTRAACVMSAAGKFCGVVSRNGLASAALRLQDEEHKRVEAESEDSDEEEDEEEEEEQDSECRREGSLQ